MSESSSIFMLSFTPVQWASAGVGKSGTLFQAFEDQRKSALACAVCWERQTVDNQFFKNTF